MSTEGQDSDRDHLTATTSEGRIELSEEELSRTTGGAKVDIKMTTTKSKVETFLALELTDCGISS